jgi:hypothetical protein
MSEPHEKPLEESTDSDSNTGPAPAAAIGSSFALKISYQHEERGFVGLNGDWCVQGADLSSAIRFKTLNRPGGKIYYQVDGGEYNLKYLSYSLHDNVGLFVWANARPWTYDDEYHWLIAHTGQKLSSKSALEPQLYAYDSYQALTVVKVWPT